MHQQFFYWANLRLVKDAETLKDSILQPSGFVPFCRTLEGLRWGVGTVGLCQNNVGANTGSNRCSASNQRFFPQRKQMAMNHANMHKSGASTNVCPILTRSWLIIMSLYLLYCQFLSSTETEPINKRNCSPYRFRDTTSNAATSLSRVDRLIWCAAGADESYVFSTVLNVGNGGMG